MVAADSFSELIWNICILLPNKQQWPVCQDSNLASLRLSYFIGHHNAQMTSSYGYCYSVYLNLIVLKNSILTFLLYFDLPVRSRYDLK